MPVLIIVTIVGSVLVCWLLPIAFKSEPPYGLAVDIVGGAIIGVIWAVIVYQFMAPIINLTGWWRLVLSAGDAIGFAAVMLWVLRRIKR